MGRNKKWSLIFFASSLLSSSSASVVLAAKYPRINEGQPCLSASETRVSASFSLNCAASENELGLTKESARPPGPVGEIGATYDELFGVRLQWSPPADRGSAPLNGYRIEYQTTSSQWLLYSTPLSTSIGTTIRHPDLSPQKVRYRVAATNSAGTGAYTESSWVDYGLSTGSTLIPSSSVVVTGPPFTNEPDNSDSNWLELNTNDGFSRRYIVFTYGENTDDDGNDYIMEVQCSAKRLTVLVYTDPVGMYPDTNRSGVGNALFKVDGGKARTISYVRMSDSSGVAFRSPRTLTNAMLNGYSKIAFKIPAVYGYQVANFAIGDFSTYARKFKAKGCLL